MANTRRAKKSTDRAERSSKGKPRETGTVRLDRYVLRRLRFERGWTVEKFARTHKIHIRTAQKAFEGEPVRMNVAEFIQKVFKVENLLDIIEPAEYIRPDSATEQVGAGPDLRDWVPNERPTPVITASNGLQYRVYKLRYRHEPSRFGRGKRYELFHLADDEQERLREHLVRHLRVCELVHGHTQFPECLETFPELGGNVWWVIDRWIEGRSLEDELAEGPLERALVPRVMGELAEAIEVAHQAGVIFRELSPSRVLLREDGSGILITDFELAKLTDDSPTVSRSWPDDPYRAPEVASGSSDVQADFYSWARILVRAATGKMPDSGADTELLKTAGIPRGVASVATKCLSRRPSDRPKDAAKLMSALRHWQ